MAKPTRTCRCGATMAPFYVSKRWKVLRCVDQECGRRAAIRRCPNDSADPNHVEQLPLVLSAINDEVLHG